MRSKLIISLFRNMREGTNGSLATNRLKFLPKIRLITPPTSASFSTGGGANDPISQHFKNAQKTLNSTLKLPQHDPNYGNNFAKNAQGQNNQQGQNNDQNIKRGVFYVGVGGGLLAAYGSYELFKNIRNIFSVSAARPFAPSNVNVEGGKRGGAELGGGGSKRRTNCNFLADVVSEVGPSVVCIETNDLSATDWVTGKPERKSNGSGFIIKEDGLILTNAHVVNHTHLALSVKLQDGRTYAAHVEDMDLNSDLATIRINARGLPVMRLGSSSEVRVGEWVVALGSPLSLSNTVTSGVISSTCRKAKEIGLLNEISYLQTDASITFGNSGGPLVNLDGEAIGVNSMKIAAGIGIAIPIDYVKKYLDDIEKRRGTKVPSRERRVFIGATLLTLSEEIARELHGSQRLAPHVNSGVLVWGIAVGSPAYKAGLQPGDVITKVNGSEVRNFSSLLRLLQSADCLKLHVYRSSNFTSFISSLYPQEFKETQPPLKK